MALILVDPESWDDIASHLKGIENEIDEVQKNISSALNNLKTNCTGKTGTGVTSDFDEFINNFEGYKTRLGHLAEAFRLKAEMYRLVDK